MLRYLIILIISSFIFTETVYRSIADKVALNINKQYNTSINKSNYTISKVDVIRYCRMWMNILNKKITEE